MRNLGFWSGALLMSAVVSSAKAVPVLTLLPNPAGYISSFARAISADGRCVVGEADFIAVVRLCNGQAEVLPGIAGLSGSPQGLDITADGKTIVGATGSGSATQNRVAFIWTEGVGISELPGLNGAGGTSRSSAFAITGDGRFIAGQSRPAGTGPSQFQAVRWQAGIPVPLDTNNQLSREIVAGSGISADGTIIIGNGVLADGSQRAFIWKESGGFSVLGLPVGTAFTSSSVAAISDDGKVISALFFDDAGNSSNVLVDNNGSVISTISAASLAGFNNPFISGLTANGKFGIGTIQKQVTCDANGCPQNQFAIIYDEAVGLRLFEDWFAELGGILPTGFLSFSLSDISPDGRFISGNASRRIPFNNDPFATQDVSTAFIIDLQAITMNVPEPASGVLLLMGVVGIYQSRRRKI
jgi:uncharacterized membrane protein